MSRQNFLTTLKYTSIAVTAALSAQAAMASGYHFGTQSTSAQSTANSSAAEAADAGTIFYNPAGLTKLEGTQVTGVMNLVAPSVKYRDAKAWYSNGDEIQGSTSGKITDSIIPVPHAYGSYQIDDKWTVGLGVYVPFASSTDYQKDSVLRYNVNQTKLTSIDINPTVAYKINDRHSIAVGLIAQYSTAELRQFADWSGLAALDNGKKAATAKAEAEALYKKGSELMLNANTQDEGKKVLAQSALKAKEAAEYKQNANDYKNHRKYADGVANVKGHDWGFGYNVGWMWDINDDVRVGVSYRSKIKHTLKGDAIWEATDVGSNNHSGMIQGDYAGITATGNTDLPLIINKGAGYHSSKAKVKIVTPESLSVHGMWKVNPLWKVYGDVTWTKHSRFNEIDIEYIDAPKVVQDPKTGSLTSSNHTYLKPNWKDTFKFSVGASYQYSDPLQLRFGVAYDQSPVRSADERLSTMPDNDRIWFSVGAKYDINKQNTIDVGYSYLYIKNADANVNGWCGGSQSGVGSQACVSSRTNGSAKFKSNAQILGMQYTYRF
jgi:long-chain fatty acid transport protein